MLAKPEWEGPIKKHALSMALRGFSKEIRMCGDLDEFYVYVNSCEAILSQCKVDLPDWWDGDGGDIPGIGREILNRETELEGE